MAFLDSTVREVGLPKVVRVAADIGDWLSSDMRMASGGAGKYRSYPGIFPKSLTRELDAGNNIKWSSFGIRNRVGCFSCRFFVMA
jgi:hypothetical protein